MQELLISIAIDAAKAAVAVLIPWLITQAIGAIKDERARRYALTVVMAAQQAIPDNDARYKYAAELVAGRFPSLKAKDVQALIEASVLTVKAAKPEPAVSVVAPQVVNIDQSEGAAPATPQQS